MKKILQSLLLLAGLMMLPAATHAQDIYGDVNSDQEVTIADVNVIIDVILGKGHTASADVNGDGEVTIADINAIINIILGGGAPTPVEHEYVDLGLPSGTLWATCNVGANNPEDYGEYYAWGETEPKQTYEWKSYLWCNGSQRKLTKYCNTDYYGTVDNKTELDPEDDAAHVNWGPEWCMPTTEQQEELCLMCTWRWTQLNDVNGYLVTGPNENTLFLPAAGTRWGSSRFGEGTDGYYWSRSLLYIMCYKANDLHFRQSSTGGVWDNGYERRLGLSIRPVRVPL